MHRHHPSPPPVHSVRGAGDIHLGQAWRGLPAEISGWKAHALRELWDRLDPTDRALLIDVWSDGWLNGKSDHSGTSRCPFEWRAAPEVSE